MLYTDNGSDFRSQHLEQVSADLKIQLIFSLPGKPRGRGRVERFFLTLTSMFLARLPGHTPAEGGTCGSPTLTLAELDVRLRNFLLDIYHQRQHSETKMTPKERWEQDGFLPRMPASMEQLDLLLLTVAKMRKVHVDGIHFQGMRYVEGTLAAYVGESVLVRYDPRDIAEIRLFHKGSFLCRAVCPELAGETVTLREITRARNQRRRELRTALQDRKKTVDSLLSLKRSSSVMKADGLEAESADDVKSTQESASPGGSSATKAKVEKPTLKRYWNE